MASTSTSYVRAALLMICVASTRAAGVQSAWQASSIFPRSTANHLGGVAVEGSRALAVGEFGSVLRSADGGKTWTAAPRASKAHLRAAAFVDSTTTVTVGADGAILRSADAGQTWTTVYRRARDSKGWSPVAT